MGEDQRVREKEGIIIRITGICQSILEFVDAIRPFGLLLMALFDILLRILENVFVVGWMALNIYVVYFTFREKPLPIEAVQSLAGDWKILLFLVGPILFRTLRKFMDEVREAWGMKREPQQIAAQSARQDSFKGQ
jgi:hypothetical protein